MNLDHVGSLLCGFCALCVFRLHVITAPKREQWMTVPPYVRLGFLLMGGMFTWRAASFWTNPSIELGHLNVEGVMASIALSYTMGALTVWIDMRTLGDLSWSRLAWLEKLLRRNPSLTPVALSPIEVVDAHRARGVHAVGPLGPPEDLN